MSADHSKLEHAGLAHEPVHHDVGTIRIFAPNQPTAQMTTPSPATPETTVLPQVVTSQIELPTLAELSFPALNRLLDAYADSLESSKAGAWERWALIVGIAGAAVGMLAGTLIPNRAGLLILRFGLIVELLGLGLSLGLTIKRDLHHFRNARTQHAVDMERGFIHYRHLVQQVRAFPLKIRQQRQRYLRDRHLVMRERLGLFTGGMERLGVIPVLLALYLQFKDWRWGDWNALGQVTLMQGIFMFFLLLAYALSWYLTSLRSRLHAYELLLTEANVEDESA